MVLAANAKNITLSSTVYPRVRAQWENDLEMKPDQTNKTFTGYINDMIMSVIERGEFIKEHMPGFELIGHSSKKLSIKDIKKNNLAEVVIRSGKIYCELDKTYDCEHIHYALMLPELIKLRSDKVRLY